MYVKRIFILLLFMLGLTSLARFVLLVDSAEADAFTPSEEPTRIWRHFTPPPTIMDVAFDGNYIWAATLDGVIRWNRNDHTFVTYTTADGLADNKVWSVVVDNVGNKWFGTESGGISKLSGNTWQTFTTSTTLNLLDNFVPIIKLHGNNLFFGTGKGVTVFDGASFLQLPIGAPSTRISAIAVESSQKMWIGTYDSGTYKLNGDNWQHYGDPSTGPGGNVRDIVTTPSGKIWFAFQDHQYGSVGRFSGGNWTRYTTDQGLINDYAQSIIVDPSDQIWIAFSDGPSGGVSIFNGVTWTSLDLNQEVGYFPGGVAKLKMDDSGHKWFMSDNYLYTFDGNNWDIFLTGLPIPPLLGAPVIGLTPNGDAWLSVIRTGIVKYDGRTWQVFTKADGLAGTFVKAIATNSANNVWLAMWEDGGQIGKGVSQFDGTLWNSYSAADGLVDDRVNDIAIDESGNVWFATLGGVSKYDGFGWETYTTDDGLAYIYVTEIAANGDDIWISYLGHYGLSHFDGNSWVTYTTADGLPANVFTDIEFDSAGNMWVAFPDGVGYFHDNIWATFPLPANSTSGYASDLAVDSMDNIWTGAYDHIDSEWLGLNHFANNTWTDYTNVGGLLSNEIDNIASHGNVIWFNEGGQAVGKLVQLYGLDERVYLPMIHK